MRYILAIAMMLAFLSPLLAACGKVGPLEAPPGAAPERSDVKLRHYKE